MLEIYQHHPCQYVRQAERGREGLPAAGLSQSGLICLGDGRVVQAIQRHGGAGALLVLRCNSAEGFRRGRSGRSRVARQARSRYIRALRGSDGIGLIIEAWPGDRVAGARIRRGRRDAGRSCRGRSSESEVNWEEEREGWAAQTLRGAWCSGSIALVLTPTCANARPTRRLTARVRRSACRSSRDSTPARAAFFILGYREPSRQGRVPAGNLPSSRRRSAHDGIASEFLSPVLVAAGGSPQPASSELHRAPMSRLQTHGRPLHLHGSNVPSANGRASHESTASNIPPGAAQHVSPPRRAACRAEHASWALGFSGTVADAPAGPEIPVAPVWVRWNKNGPSATSLFLERVGACGGEPGPIACPPIQDPRRRSYPSDVPR